MSWPRCGTCGQELGLTSATRCAHQPLPVAPTKTEPADPPWLENILLDSLAVGDQEIAFDSVEFDAVIPRPCR